MNDKKDKSVYVFYITLFTSICLLCGSFFCPPLGVVDSSALKSVAELEIFAVIWAFYDLARKGKTAQLITKGTTLKVSSDKEENDEE